MNAPFWQNNLKFLRKKSGKNQTDIGSLVNKTQKTIANWENGKAEPSIGEIGIITQYFSIPVADFLFSDLSKGGIKAKLNQQEEAPKGGIKGGIGGEIPTYKSVFLAKRQGDFSPFLQSDYGELQNDDPRNNVFDLTTKAAAGSIGHIVQETDKRRVKPNLFLPGLGHGIHVRVPIGGDSMYPTIKDGDKAVGTLIANPDSIKQGHVYLLLDKEEGLVCKRVYWEDEETFDLISDNEAIMPYTRHLSDIIAVFKVREVHTRDLRPLMHDVRKEMREIRSEMKVLRGMIEKNTP